MTDKLNPMNIDQQDAIKQRRIVDEARSPPQAVPMVDAIVKVLESSAPVSALSLPKPGIRSRLSARRAEGHYAFRSRLHQGDRHVITIDDVPLTSIGTARIRDSRQSDDEGDFRCLVDSMAREGQINPVTAQRDPIRNDHFILLAGWRRLRAASELGWKTIRVSVVECEGECDAHMVNLQENAARRDLSTWELAAACEHLHKNFGLTVTELSGRLGYSQSHVCGLLLYLALPPIIVEAWKQRHPLMTLPNLQRLKTAGPGALDLFTKMQAAHTRREGKPIPNAPELLLAQLKADDPEVEAYAPTRRPSAARLNKVRDRVMRSRLPTNPAKVRDLVVGILDFARGVRTTVPGLLL